MLQPRELKLEEMGDLAEIIPGPEPTLIAQRHPIPQFGAPVRRPIIPVCEPWLAGNELKYITEAVETNWISSAGGYIHRFEALFAEKMGALRRGLREWHRGPTSGAGDPGVGAGR